MGSDFIVVSLKRNLKRRLFVSDIFYCESDQMYTKLFLEHGLGFLFSETLIRFEERLESSNFYRISRKYLVNVDKLLELDLSSSPSVLLTNNVKLKVSKSRLEGLKRKFEM